MVVCAQHLRMSKANITQASFVIKSRHRESRELGLEQSRVSQSHLHISGRKITKYMVIYGVCTVLANPKQVIRDMRHYIMRLNIRAPRFLQHN